MKRIEILFLLTSASGFAYRVKAIDDTGLGTAIGRGKRRALLWASLLLKEAWTFPYETCLCFGRCFELYNDRERIEHDHQSDVQPIDALLISFHCFDLSW